ncbi:hypothetical protein ACFFIY_12025 [Bhargavaea ullalensis]|uniref:Uncharacterized protein n=1 Tax=Bhargavaea ullalensis TaxID=1265685 RepID=A0ABV2G7D4_9BACL
MWILKLQGALHERGGILTLEDNLSKSVEGAVRKGDLDYVLLRTLLYEGFEGQSADRSAEQQYAEGFLEKFPGLFTQCGQGSARFLRAAVRSDFDLFRNHFLTGRPFIRAERLIGHLLGEQGPFRVGSTLDPARFGRLSEELGTIPYIRLETVTDESAGQFDALLLDRSRPAAGVGEMTDRMMFLHLGRRRIEIGPLLFTDRFECPEEEPAGDPSTGSPGEEALMYAFVRRILFIVLFGLYDELSEDVGLPLRTRLSIDRITLEARAEPVAIRPVRPESALTKAR